MSVDQDGGISPGQDAPDPVYPGVESWVTGQFLPVYKRPLGGEYRCAGDGGSTPRPSSG